MITALLLAFAGFFTTITIVGLLVFAWEVFEGLFSIAASICTFWMRD